jgi:hypothetical protein
MSPIILAMVSCYGLSPDLQAYCQARQHNEVSFCYNIKDSALRETCRADIHQMPSNCDSISSDEARQLCRNKAAR